MPDSGFAGRKMLLEQIVGGPRTTGSVVDFESGFYERFGGGLCGFAYDDDKNDDKGRTRLRPPTTARRPQLELERRADRSRYRSCAHLHLTHFPLVEDSAFNSARGRST
jgi:hypothetical protein